MSEQTILILNDIRSVHNVGSIFRTADAAGVTELFLVGYTPLPVDRFGRINHEIKKTALGGERSVPWKHVRTWNQCEEKLRKDGYSIVVVEQAPRAVSYRRLRGKRDPALVFGNEVRGVPKQVLDRADMIVELPMRGKKESLNVAVAAGIILYSL